MYLHTTLHTYYKNICMFIKHFSVKSSYNWKSDLVLFMNTAVDALPSKESNGIQRKDKISVNALFSILIQWLIEALSMNLLIMKRLCPAKGTCSRCCLHS